jgi:hypothetical protein
MVSISPVGGVTLDNAGNLYGVTFGRGKDRGGLVFKVTP